MLIVLTVIQIAWLHSASKAAKRDLEMRSVRALEKTDKEMGARNYCMQGFSKMYLNPNEGFYILRGKCDSSGAFFGKRDTVNLYISTADNGRKDSNVYSFPVSYYAHPEIVEIWFNFRMEAEDSLNFRDEQKKFREKVSANQLKDIRLSKIPITSIFDMDTVNSMLEKNLRREGINRPFGFGFILEKENKIEYSKRITDTVALKKSLTSVGIFASNKFMQPYRLALIYKDAPMLYNISSWLFISIAVIILLMFAFYSFVVLYLKQARLSQMKSDFVHNLTHEFNTPVSNIKLAIETLQNSIISKEPKTAKILGIINAETSRLKENVERSLQMVVIEEGNPQLKREQIDMVLLVNSVMEAYQFQCESLGGGISFSCSGNPVLYGDETHIMNCIVNLVDNAVKYKRDIPEISISIEERANEIILEVSDKGIGMSAETQKNIFQKFYRAHEGDRHNTKGFGLGLSYVYGIVTAHGGTITAWSKKGQGSRFTIKLPKNEYQSSKKNPHPFSRG